MARRTAVAVAALSVAAVAVPAPSSTAAAPPRISCDAFDVSPDFATDGTILCVARHKPRPQDEVSGVDVFLSTDKGRSWKQQAGTGLVVRRENFWGQVVFSPRYKHDRTIYVQEIDDGLYRTTDGGATFTLVDPLAKVAFGAGPSLTPLLTAPLAGVPLPVGQEPESAVAHAGGRLPAVIAPPLRRPVAGSPAGGVTQFLIPSAFPTQPASAVVSIPATAATPWRHEVALCTPQLACADTTLVMPGYFRVVHAGVHPTAKHAPTVVIARGALGPEKDKTMAWRSTDAGRTYHRLPKLETPLRAAGDYTAFITTGPKATLWLKVDHTSRSSRVPRSQLLRSADGGVTWTRLAYSKSTTPLKVSGMPSPAALPSGGRSWLHVARDGRVLVLGASPPYGASSIYCSTTLRHWRATC